MAGNSTYIKDPAAPDQEPRKFAFDYSYWSHDGFRERDDGYLEPSEPTYADQVRESENNCVVPERIHTHPMEGHWKFLGGGGS